LRRVSPLVAALVVSGLPWLATTVTLGVRNRFFGSYDVLSLLDLAATSIVALWLCVRCRNSLLPVLVLFSVAQMSTIAVEIFAWSGFGGSPGAHLALVGAEWVLALGLIGHGRMWRSPVRPSDPGPAPVVADLPA
jgi:hypothetical protein